MVKKHEMEDPSFKDGLKTETASSDIDRVQAIAEASAMSSGRERLWRMENAEAIDAMNDYIERNGLPLARWRPF